ncbi:uncharacterized protein LOC133647711 isoform X2 [Entelurus aequoreus]|uniref:uncharacterized protein LOC133647711 isoform X2 n=1 Tax=Entelurus aequoreus TaxID=161455 RepID=UPI002B1D2FC0|nr:uncharacterized protein LOC133647711 isoform X2 [Entelurus aequoreus]
MWRYRKPGFKALLVAELQRQQQHRQFCDTLLRAEGVSVPAHSCVLSAISPQLSTALSSSPTPPAGQHHVVEFGTLGASTLLHLVKLLYSGEMAGEGESEKRRAVSAAAKMGIQELVDVTQRAEVGVQTDPVAEDKVTGEVMDGSTVLWNETNGGKYVQTGGPQVSCCPPVPTYETIDMSQLQSLRHPPHVSGHTPDIAPQSLPSQDTLWPAFFSGLLEGHVAANQQFEQYRDNIPGFISHFLNSDRREAARAKRKARGAGAAVQRRPRGGWMQKVDVQTVVASKQHRSLLHRCGTAAAVRTGQGGGATGRKLYLKTRHILDSFWRKRGRGLWKGFSPGGESHYEMGGGGNVTCRQRTKQECEQVSPALPRLPHPPPHEDPSERFNRLLEEVLMGLNAPHSQPCQQRYAAVTTEVVATGQAGAGDADAEVGFLEPQVEGDLTAMLEDFLQSFGQHGDGGVVGEVEHSSPEKQSQRSKASGNTRSKKRQEKKQTPGSVSDIINRNVGEGDNKRLGRTSVVKVRQQSALQNPVTHPIRSRRNKVQNMPLPEIKRPLKAPGTCRPRKNTRRLTEIPGTPAAPGTCRPRKNTRRLTEIPGTPAAPGTCRPRKKKTRRLTEIPGTPAAPGTCRPRKNTRRLTEIPGTPAAPGTCRPRKNTRRLTEIPGTPAAPGTCRPRKKKTRRLTEIPGKPAGHGNLIKRNEKRGGNKAAEEKEGKEVARRAQKRHLKPREEMRNIGSEAKKKYFKANPPPPSSTSTCDEMVVRAGVGDSTPVDHIGEQNQELANLDNVEGSCWKKAPPCLSPPLLSSWEVRPGTPGSKDEDEDIDVIGTWDSIPNPITITWSTSSGSEEEEIDVTEVCGLLSEPSCGPHQVSLR